MDSINVRDLFRDTKRNYQFFLCVFFKIDNNSKLYCSENTSASILTKKCIESNNFILRIVSPWI